MVSLNIMRRRARRIAAAGLALALLGGGAATAGAQETGLTLHEAAGRDRVPWERLDASAYELVRDVVQDAAVTREVRDITFRSHKPVFDFLFDHPDFAADVARVLREGKYRVRRVGDAYEADDGRGVRGLMRLLLSEDGRRVFYLEGRYDPPLLPALSGRLVILLDTEHLDGPDGVTYCAMKFSGFLKLDSVIADAFARLAHKLSEDQVDKRVRRFFGHVAAVSRRAYDDPEGLAELLAARPELPADQVTRFRELLFASVTPGLAASGEYRFLDSPALSTTAE
jgi:hypothetical protein